METYKSHTLFIKLIKKVAIYRIFVDILAAQLRFVKYNRNNYTKLTRQLQEQNPHQE